ncbi:hypothetical protein CLF_111284 [Clonorchis sinensis]|uniref:Uncharacterized protein n=1 Tax=Clonorchis sinensis TaxID=79923 RepID=G7YUL1_CLOSI|nr:hypothetical protein CLF_111284 [Clonorchis sinensis]
MVRHDWTVFSVIFLVCLLLAANGSSRQSVSELRILFKLNVDERRVRDAQNLGQVYPYLYGLACTNVTYLARNRKRSNAVKFCMKHPLIWPLCLAACRRIAGSDGFNTCSCQIGKYHINRFSDQTAIVLVDSETSTAADEELASIQDDDQKLLTIANRWYDFEVSRYMHGRNTLLKRLLKILRQPTTGIALLVADSSARYTHLQVNLVLRRPTRNSAESVVYDVEEFSATL